MWNGTTHAQLQGQHYWGGKPVAFYKSGQTHFQHQDWLGTERMRTTYNGTVEGSFTSLPFGDGQAVASGTDLDPYHYASLDSDSETGTDHAQFRQYNSTQGRWMRPDPYSGSYDFSNPQSLNRYAYVLNNPLALTDPTGQDCEFVGPDYDPAISEDDEEADVPGDDDIPAPSASGPLCSDNDDPGAASPPPGYSPSGVNTSDGNLIYSDDDGNMYIEAPVPPPQVNGCTNLGDPTCANQFQIIPGYIPQNNNAPNNHTPTKSVGNSGYTYNPNLKDACGNNVYDSNGYVQPSSCPMGAPSKEATCHLVTAVTAATILAIPGVDLGAGAWVAWGVGAGGTDLALRIRIP